MGSVLDKEHAEKIWGSKNVAAYEEEKGIKLVPTISNELRDQKIRIAKDLCKDLYIQPYVKMIGISGSVAAGIMKDNDDIDLFIVVQDHFSWLYRIFAKFRLGSRVIWFGDKDKRNNICLNFISEERGLALDAQDIFNMHEIYYLVPIYGIDYFNKLLVRNPWLRDKFYARVPTLDLNENKVGSVQLLFFIPNFIAFMSQVMYMLMMGHSPETGRLFNSYRRGRIEFYKSDFRTRKLERFYKDRKDSNNEYPTK